MSAKKKDEEYPHPLRTMTEVMIGFGLDFTIIVGGTKDEKVAMGMPEYLCEQQVSRLDFPSEFASVICPSPDNEKLSACLSFDSLYNVEIPWVNVVTISCLYGEQKHVSTLYQKPSEWVVVNTTTPDTFIDSTSDTVSCEEYDDGNVVYVDFINRKRIS